MADQIALSADARPGGGKGEARALRRAGRVPAIAYGAGLESTPIHVDALDLRHALATDAGENVVLSMDIAGDTHLAMPREIHRHPVQRDVLHLDFVAIDRNVKVTVEIPLHVVGEAVEGSVTNQVMNVLTVDVLPLEVPESFEVSVEGKEIGDVVRCGDIELPEGVDLLDDPERTAVTINLPDAAPVEETDEVAEGAEGEAAEAAEDDAAEGGEE